MTITGIALVPPPTAASLPKVTPELLTSVLARYSGDATGKWLEEVVEPQRIGSFIALYDTVIALRVPLRIITRYQAPELDYLDGESFVAPLSVPTSDTPLILSVTYAKPRKDDMSFAPSFAVQSA